MLRKLIRKTKTGCRAIGSPPPLDGGSWRIMASRPDLSKKKKMEYCKCNCGEVLDFSMGRKNKEYKQGHYSRVYNAGGVARRGKKPWNKDIPRTKEEREKISSGKKGKSIRMPPGFYKHLSVIFKGRKMPWLSEFISLPKTEEHKNKISKTLKEKYIKGELISPFYIDGRYKDNPKSVYNQYGDKFTKELKNVVRKRDNWTCQQCEKKRSITCHHIDENKLNNSKENLIILCKKCHIKYHRLNQKEKNKLKRLYRERIKLNEES